MAENYEISEDKTIYTVRIKQNILWHDEQPLTAKDILFTINLFSNPTYKSPLRSNWHGVEAKILDDYSLEFKIKNPYVGFLSNLTFGILPKHIWSSISSENFSLNPLNLKPVGTGPYRFSSIQKDSNDNILSYKLTSNPNYYFGKPYISKITFNFYTDEDSALEALTRKEIMGLSGFSSEKLSSLAAQKSISIHKFKLPRYIAIFFNQTKSIPIASNEVREALNYATNRQEIIDQVLGGNGQESFSPFPKGIFGYSENIEYPNFDPAKAEEILEKNNWQKNSEGWRMKNETILEIKLTTTDWENFIKTAELLKAQWEKIGIKVSTEFLPIFDIQENHIRPREYEALLFGQVLSADPDPYPFWHSNQKNDPGLNLSLFNDTEADKLIDSARVEFNEEKRASLYADFQKIIQKENPAIFLYSPSYVYPVNRKVQGIDMQSLISPCGRFSDISHWYIKTKRIKK